MSVPTPTTVPTATTGSQGTEVAGGTDLDAFQSSLMQAVVERNGQIMVQAMGDPFTIAGWQAEGAEWEPDDAVDQLFTRCMAAGATITFGEPQPNLTNVPAGALRGAFLWACRRSIENSGGDDRFYNSNRSALARLQPEN